MQTTTATTGREFDERELEILERIYEHPENVHQRDLARIVGLSLGMTNAILKRLAQKGYLTIRKVNNRNIRYAVSPDGVELIAHRSYRYLRRTIKNVVYYRHAIEELVRKIRDEGYDGLVLVGASDLDFIVEHACRSAGVSFIRDDRELSDKVFLLYSESYIPDDESRASGAFDAPAFLQDVLTAE
jgi:DNA-binding MarR family transcriptional regulator